jgi:pimeloyl-ACP methyl ester carboxylesterase
MEYSTFTTTDRCPLAFQSSLPLPPPSSPTPSTPNYATCILLLHGFSGSSAYFTHNFAPLAPHHWLLAPDMRGHGRSGHNPSRGGFHVARLAADLRELLLHVSRLAPAGTTTKTKFVPVGCSIGAAVVWTYLELFGEAGADEFELAGFVFVDQAPLQDRSALGGGGGEGLAHRGCFDEASMLAAQRAWVYASAGAVTNGGLVRVCLGYRLAPR